MQKEKYTTTEEANAYFLSQLKYTNNNLKLNTEERIEIVNQILADGAEKHYKDVSQRLLDDCNNIKERIALYHRMIERPLEQMGSYLCGETDIDRKERRQKYDGQKRKRKDGTIYQRQVNCTESIDDPNLIISYYEHRYDIDDTIDLFKLKLNDKENIVLDYLLNDTSMADIERSTDLSYKQVRNLREKLQCKVLEELYNEQNTYQFNKYKHFCKKINKITEKGAKVS